MMRSVYDDFRLAIRLMMKSPGFSLVAIFSLAIGIGANLTVFSLANGLLLRTLPVRDPATVIEIYETTGGDYRPLSYPDLAQYRTARSLRGVAAYSVTNFAVGSGAATQLHAGAFVDSNYFALLGVAPIAGRDVLGNSELTQTMISTRLARELFGTVDRAVGSSVTVNGRVLSIGGVLSPKFQPIFGLSTDIFVPLRSRATLEPAAPRLDDFLATGMQAVARTTSNDAGRVEHELNLIAKQLDASAPRPGRTALPRRIRVAQASVLAPGARVPLTVIALLMFVVTGLVLLLACTNLANLLLSRASARRRELAVRAALGATQARIVRQLVFEALVLAMAAGVAAVLLANAATVGLLALLPSAPSGLLVPVTPDARIIPAATLFAGVAALLFSLGPALSATRYDLVSGLKDSGAGSGITIGQIRNRRRLVGVQVGITTVLLVTAGLFVRSLGAARGMDAGFAAERVLLATVDVSRRFPTPDAGRRAYDELLTRLRSDDGVRDASIVQRVPLDFGNQATVFAAAGGAPMVRHGAADCNIVGTHYFATMGIPLRAGRDFSSDGGANEVIVNETLARKFFPQGAIGNRIAVRGDETRWLEIVGVARDGKYRTLTEAPQPFIYLPHAGSYAGEMTVAIATRGDARSALALLRGAVTRVDANIPVYQVRTADDHLRAALFPARMAGILLGTLGSLTLVLAALGIYGVMSYGTQLRRAEIGLRMALGGEAQDVMLLVVRQGMAPVGFGMAAGVVLALLVSRGIHGFLYGITPMDPITYAGVAAVIVVTAVLACLLPAWRATRMSPSVVFREA
ncbi:MAG TPA: ADOP family duplicated permease [Gemmatimonadaceae bacterium]|nr:ADOP family duplicated permease [Gemmatimonadaceae bacterium]